MVKKISKTACNDNWEKKGEYIVRKTIMNIPFEIHNKLSYWLIVNGRVILNCKSIKAIKKELFIVLSRVEKELPAGYIPVINENEFNQDEFTQYPLKEIINETDPEWIEEYINSACFHVKNIIKKQEWEIDGFLLSKLFYSIGYHLCN